MRKNALLQVTSADISKTKGIKISLLPAIHFKAGWTILMGEYYSFYKFVPAQGQLEAVFNNICSDKVKSLVAIIDDQIVAAANFLYHPHTFSGKVCFVNDLIVAEKFRRLGIATQLLAKIAEEAANMGCTKVYWNTTVDNPACKLYDKVSKVTPWIRYEIFPLQSKL